MKIKVMSYNIHKGFSLLNYRFSLHELKKDITRIHPDVILLQEVVGENLKFKKKIRSWPSESQFEFLAESIWPHHTYGKNAVWDHKHHGNAILSKFPIKLSENINLTNHPLENRGLLYAEIQIPHEKKSLHIMNTHLDLTSFGRKKQIKKIISHAEKHIPKDSPIILGGDFNDWDNKITPQLTKKLNFSEIFLEQDGSHAFTFPSLLPILKLDRIYFKNLGLVKAKKIQHKLFQYQSDHIPIVAEFILS